MALIMLTVFLLLVLFDPVWMRLISGTINHDTSFFHMMLSDVPSKEVSLEYFLSFNQSTILASGKCSEEDGCTPILGFHTTNDDVHIRDRCFSRSFGQVRNGHLRTPLRVRHSSLTYDSLGDTQFTHFDGILTAKAKIKIYDYKERKFSFSLGFKCATLLVRQNLSVKGISYNFDIFEQQSNTFCHLKVPPFTGILHKCPQFYSHMSEENLVGVVDSNLSEEHNENVILHLQTFKRMFLNSSQGMFYKHFDELLCRFFLPECEPKQNIVIHPCQEMCNEFLDAAWKTLKHRLPDMLKLFPSVVKSFMEAREYDNALDCSYLPSINDSIPCLYKPVMCGLPPVVKYAKVNNSKEKHNVNSTVEYNCVSEKYKMVGNASTTCLYSGYWSPPPTCQNDSLGLKSPLVIVVTILSLPLSLFVAVTIWYSCKHHPMTCDEVSQLNQRETDFDAFLCYNFDRENNFVVNELLPEIDEYFYRQEIGTREHQALIPVDETDEINEINADAKTCKKRCWCCRKCDTTIKNSNKIELNNHGDLRVNGFKILIESRDFVPALLVDVNIENAIKKSNCAILLVSQGFVNSPWCRKEFELCKLENENDRSFKIFVIMMQPPNELENVNSSMRSFLETTTFLKKDDPDLINKLRHNLTGLRKIHGSPV